MRQKRLGGHHSVADASTAIAILKSSVSAVIVHPSVNGSSVARQVHAEHWQQ